MYNPTSSFWGDELFDGGGDGGGGEVEDESEEEIEEEFGVPWVVFFVFLFFFVFNDFDVDLRVIGNIVVFNVVFDVHFIRVMNFEFIFFCPKLFHFFTPFSLLISSHFHPILHVYNTYTPSYTHTYTHNTHISNN